MTDLHQGLPFPRRIAAACAISIAGFLCLVDASIAGVLLPTIANELHVERSSTVLIVTAYQLVLAMTLMPFAAIGDRIGHRRLFQVGVLVNCSGAIFCFFSNSLAALIIVRSLQAFGTAALMSVSVALIRATYPAARLGGGLAVNTATNAVGTAVAPVIGGFILSVANWHWGFVTVVPLCIAALGFSRALPDPQPREHRFDLLGAGLCALTFGCVIAGSQGAIQTGQLLLSIGVVVLGLLIACFFVRHEMRIPEPVLPIDLFKIPVVALSIFSCLCAMLSSITLLLVMPFRLQHGYGFSPGEIGGLMAAYAAASVMIAPAAGFLSDRIPVALLSTIGMSVALAGLLCIALLPAPATHFDIAWRMWLCGAGFGMFFSPNARLIIGAAPPKRSASAGSLFTTTRMLGQAIGATLVAALLAFNLGEGAIPALVSMCLAGIAAAVSAFALLRRGNT